MTTIPAGYRLAIITPDGTIADTVNIEGADLTKQLAALDLGLDVDHIIATREALLPEGA